MTQICSLRQVCRTWQTAIDADRLLWQQLQLQEKARVDKAIHALEPLTTARAGLDTLQLNDINELRSFANPPHLVYMVVQLVTLILGDVGPGSWADSKRALTPPTNFLRRLVTLDPDSVSAAALHKAEQHILSDHTITVRQMQAVSKAATQLLQWARGILHYRRCMLPDKRTALRCAQRNYDMATRHLALMDAQN